MTDFYAARSRIIPPLPWPTFAPPLTIMDLFREWQVQHAVASDCGVPEAVGEAASDRLRQIEASMRALPSTCMADLAAKLITDSSDGIFELGDAIMAEARALVG